MDYPLREGNWVCRLFRCASSASYTGRDGIARRTCTLCGRTVPPFRKLCQVPPYDYLPDEEQPPGAI